MTNFIGGILIGMAVSINRHGDITEYITPWILMVIGIVLLEL